MLGALASPAALSLSQQLGGLPQAVMAAQAPGVITGTQADSVESERGGGVEGEIERGVGREERKRSTDRAAVATGRPPARPPRGDPLMPH